jgi:O-antigen biosynthesis protein WbqV
MPIHLLGRAGKFAVHLTLAFLAWLAAEGLATGWATGFASLIAAGLFALSAGLVELLFRVERAPWRFVAVPDVLRLGRSAVATALLFIVMSSVLAPAFGVGAVGGWRTLVVAVILDFTALAGLRILRRAMLEGGVVATLTHLRPAPRATSSRTPLLIVGPAADAEAFLRAPEAALGDRYSVVGVVTPHARHVGDELRGVCVLGAASDFDEVIATLGAGSANPRAILFLSPPDILGSERLGRLKSEGVRLLRLPGVIDLSAARGRMHEISIEELLTRPPVQLDREAGRALVAERRVLVTGAGGSIGSELARQIAAGGCARLILLDASEAALFQIEQEIVQARPDVDLTAVLCDVRDRTRLDAVLQAERPSVVFHAAALKHVPLVEHNPGEGVRTNVLGARNITEAARAAGVEHLTFISTDKAVAPASVMGATKRVAEAIVRQAGAPTLALSGSSPPSLRTSVVRFGNVLGSTGSVATIFRRQIERGGPVTVTHEAMERYFMTIPEAVSLVLRAAALAANDDSALPGVMTLEMGEPVRIIDLARRMIELQGLVPGRDIAIEVTGLRPGEKLTEELVDVNETQTPCAPGVNQATAVGPVLLVSERDLKTLETLALAGDNAALRQALFDLVERLRGVTPQAAPEAVTAPKKRGTRG